jgi:hypothetical protein
VRISTLVRPALAGVAGSIAYLAEQEIDRRFVNPRSNDLLLVGGFLTQRPTLWLPLGLLGHLSAGAAFGVAFERIVAPWLIGPLWLRGVLMAEAENAVLWPLVSLLDQTHPAVQTGALTPMNRPVYFGQAVLRHAALGAAIGIVLSCWDAAEVLPRTAVP